jgi:hypothetical protein
MPSSRSKLTKFLQDQFLLVSNSRYKFVKRGPVDWRNFPFDQYERAVSILVDRNTFQSDARGMNTMDLAIEMFAKLPSEVDPANIDDGLMDDFYEDAQHVMKLADEFKEKIKHEEYPLLFRRDQGVAVESHDATLKVQGLIVNMTVTY